MDTFLLVRLRGIKCRIGTLRIVRDPSFVRQRLVIIGAIPIAAPFPDVAGHVVKAVTVRRKRFYRRDASIPIFNRVFDRKFSLPRVRHPFTTGTKFIAHTYVFPDKPPRAANSNSASVGKRLPAHLAYASASGYAICTTGYFSFPLRSLSGPSGCRQFAPLT